MRTLLVAASALIVVLAGCAAPADEGPAGTLLSGDNDSPYRGSFVDPPFPMPEQQFTTTDDQDVTLADVAGDVTVVLFAYTNCPDVCNAQLAAMTAALRQVPDDVAGRTEIVMITTDPARDDGPTMRRYLDAFGDEFVGLRADLATTNEAASELGVFIERGVEVPGGYEVDHGAQLIAFGANGQAPVFWQPGVAVADIAADVTTLHAEVASEQEPVA